MTLKNKLYKHHKSKLVLIMRNLSISITGFFAIGAIVAIPTYITSNSLSEAEAKEEAPINHATDEIPSEEKEEILAYLQD